jgi:transmembrane sensor
MEERKLRELIYKYQSQQCSEEEVSMLEAWYDVQVNRMSGTVGEQQLKEDLDMIYKKLPGRLAKRSLNYPLSIAASLIMILASSVAFYHFYSEKGPAVPSAISANLQTSPSTLESGKSYLTLAGGRRISLTEAPIGSIITQHGIQLKKLKDDVIAFSYVSDERPDRDSQSLSTLTTSRGAQLQVVLTDGTKIWINAGSSLKFPTTFSGKKRHVELEGEAYFEVAKNKHFPFEVQTRLEQVQVLGTHFNVCSYANEPVTKTTLLEGKVEVINRSRQNNVILKPGEQSVLNEHANLEVAKVDVDDAVAWKRGLFQFRNSDLAYVSRQLARWYNVDFELAGNVPDIRLWGDVHRNVSLEKALELLTFFELGYKVQYNHGVKTVIITAKKTSKNTKTANTKQQVQ